MLSTLGVRQRPAQGKSRPGKPASTGTLPGIGGASAPLLSVTDNPDLVAASGQIPVAAHTRLRILCVIGTINASVVDEEVLADRFGPRTRDADSVWLILAPLRRAAARRSADSGVRSLGHATKPAPRRLQACSGRDPSAWRIDLGASLVPSSHLKVPTLLGP